MKVSRRISKAMSLKKMEAAATFCVPTRYQVAFLMTVCKEYVASGMTSAQNILAVPPGCQSH